MAHKLNLVDKTGDGKIIRTTEQVLVSETLGKKIADLIQAHLSEIGAAICEGKAYEKRNGEEMHPFSVQGTINMPPLTYDDGGGEQQTHKWFINFRAGIPDVKGTVRPAVNAAPVRAMTIAERRAQLTHK